MKTSLSTNQNLNQNLAKLAFGVFVLGGMYYLVEKLCSNPSFQQLFTRAINSLIHPDDAGTSSSIIHSDDAGTSSSIIHSDDARTSSPIIHPDDARTSRSLEGSNEGEKKGGLKRDFESFLNIISSKDPTPAQLSFLLNLGNNILLELSLRVLRDLLELNQICTEVYEKFCDEKGIEKESRYDIAKLRKCFPILEKPETRHFHQFLSFIRDYRTYAFSNGATAAAKPASSRMKGQTKKLAGIKGYTSRDLGRLKSSLPKNENEDTAEYIYDVERHFNVGKDDEYKLEVCSPIRTSFDDSEPSQTTEKVNSGQSSSQVELQAHVAHWKGGRETQEDRDIFTQISVKAKNSSGVEQELSIPVMGILDGHGGDKCPEFIKHHLPSIIEECLELFILENGGYINDQVVYDALKLSFTLARDEFRASYGRDESGTTVNISLLVGDKLFTANSGDSKSVLGKAQGERYIGQELSKEHKPKDQRKQVEKRGSTILCGKVDANLAVGRSIEGSDIGIDPRPTITVHNLQGGETLSYFCDGLGDHLKKERETNLNSGIISASSVGAFAAKLTAEENPDKNPARDLVRLGIQQERDNRGRDNISALVVEVPTGLQPIDGFGKLPPAPTKTERSREFVDIMTQFRANKRMLRDRMLPVLRSVQVGLVGFEGFKATVEEKLTGMKAEEAAELRIYLKKLERYYQNTLGAYSNEIKKKTADEIIEEIKKGDKYKDFIDDMTPATLNTVIKEIKKELREATELNDEKNSVWFKTELEAFKYEHLRMSIDLQTKTNG